MVPAPRLSALFIAAVVSVPAVVAHAQETAIPGSTTASSEIVYTVNVDERRMKPPQVIVKTDPIPAPPVAGNEPAVGSVAFEGEIGLDGKVRNVQKISSSVPEELEKKAAQTIKDWKFKPGEVDGRPVVVKARFEITFRALEKAATQQASTATLGKNGATPLTSGVRAGVTPPKVLEKPEPQFTPEARRAHVQGTVTLSAFVGVDGRAHDVEIVKSLDRGLDAVAKKTISDSWRFKPGQQDGHPVPVKVMIQVNFHLYDGIDDLPMIVTSGNSYPEYPRSALGSNISGTVFLEATVGKNGKPHDIEVIKGVSPELDEEAKQVVEKKWRFEPRTEKGNLVASRVRIAIHFDANDIHPKMKRAEAALLPYKVQ